MPQQRQVKQPGKGVMWAGREVPGGARAQKHTHQKSIMSIRPDVDVERMLSFSLRDLDILDVGAPKRKLGVTAVHGGLPTDTSLPVRLLVLSRFIRTKDEAILLQTIQTPGGAAALAALEAAFAAAAAALTVTQVKSFFAQSGSAVATKRLWEAGLTLPAALPWEKAKQMLAALLAALAAVRETGDGYLLARRIMQPTPLTPEDRAALAALAGDVETRLRAQLGPPPQVPPSSSSARSSPSTVPPSAAPPAAQINVAESLAANIRKSLEARMGRLLSAADAASLNAKLEEALSLLQAGSVEQRQQLLAAVAPAALSQPSGALLWAAVLEAAANTDGTNAAAMFAAILETTATFASAMFASAVLGGEDL